MLEIQTERLIIRDHKMEDAEEYFSLISNKKEMFYLPDLYREKHEDAVSLLKYSIDEANMTGKRTRYFLGIFLKSGSYVGEIGYTVTSEDDEGFKNVHLGYFTKEKFWGKGFVTEAVKGLLPYAFTMNNVQKIETGCLCDNIGSEKIMMKCGFIKEGYKRNHQYLHGKWRDRVEYGLLKKDFPL